MQVIRTGGPALADTGNHAGPSQHVGLTLGVFAGTMGLFNVSALCERQYTNRLYTVTTGSFFSRFRLDASAWISSDYFCFFLFAASAARAFMPAMICSPAVSSSLRRQAT